MFNPSTNRDGIAIAAAVTASDSTILTPPLPYTSPTPGTRGLYIGTAGNVAVVFSYDPSRAVTLSNLAVGVWHPMSVLKVMSTNTTASNIVAGW